jgi:hypothetical protein
MRWNIMHDVAYELLEAKYSHIIDDNTKRNW